MASTMPPRLAQLGFPWRMKYKKMQCGEHACTRHSHSEALLHALVWPLVSCCYREVWCSAVVSRCGFSHHVVIEHDKASRMSNKEGSSLQAALLCCPFQVAAHS